MSYYLRALILFASLITLFYVLRRIRKAQLQLQDSLFWIFLSIVFVLMGAFPQIVYAASRLFGFQAPVNFIYMVIICILLLKVFLSSIKISQLENKLDQLVQELAIDVNLHETGTERTAVSRSRADTGQTAASGGMGTERAEKGRSGTGTAQTGKDSGRMGKAPKGKNRSMSG